MFEGSYDEAKPVTGQPIDLKASLGTATDFPIEALSPTIRGAIEAIHDIVKLPVAAAAQSVLSAAALVCQCRFNVELPTRQTVPTSLFFFTVAQSGDRKTTSDRHALKPIADFEKRMKDEQHIREAAYEIDKGAYDAALTSAKRKGTSRSDKADAIRDCGSPPVKPPAGIMITDEATVPGLQKLFAEAMPSLGLFSDDGASWLSGYSMQEEQQAGTGASLSHLWDGKPVKRVRATGFELHYGRRLSLHLMVQPGVALKLFGNKALRDQGMMSRMLVAYPESMRGTRFWTEAAPESWSRLNDYQAKLARRIAQGMRFKDDQTRELLFDTLTLSSDARAKWIEFSDHCERLMGPEGLYEPIGDFASKMPENATRIAAVLSYFERTPEALAEDGISEAALRAGIALVQFYALEALRLFSAGSVDDDSDNATLLIEWIRKKGFNQVGAQYLSQSAPKSVRSGVVLKRAINLLVEHGHLAEIKTGATIKHGSSAAKHYREAYTVVPIDE
jgi:hypothetical protein